MTIEILSMRMIRQFEGQAVEVNGRIDGNVIHTIFIPEEEFVEEASSEAQAALAVARLQDRHERYLAIRN